MPRIVKVSAWLRSHFTASELSGWGGVDVAGSLSEQEVRLLRRKKIREGQLARKCENHNAIPLVFQNVLD